MILTRLGNKRHIAKKIQVHFPRHTCYVEPFFGAGGMFFYKPKAKYNFLNDLDDDVFNLFMVVMDRKDELIEVFKIMPEHQSLMDYWNKHTETEPIRKALRFLLLSNFGYMGQRKTLHLAPKNPKNMVLTRLDKVQSLLEGAKFTCKDANAFLKSLTKEKSDTCFIYCDPPYLDTTNNYSQGFTDLQVVELFDTLQSMQQKFAYSEFDHPFIIQQAKQRGLNIIKIGEKKYL